MSFNIVILAAGQGTRMRSKLPKVLHELAAKPLLKHVVDTASGFSAQRTVVVYGHGGDAVKAKFSDHPSIHWAKQTEQLGTGHAVAQALPWLADGGHTLILYGDVPLVSNQTLEKLIRCASEKTLALLTVNLQNPTGYGRIVRNSDGDECAIIEEKDATDAQKTIQETNTGILVAPTEQLKAWIPQLNAQNAQNEYYLTDVIAMAAASGTAIQTVQPQHTWEVEGVNNRLQLANLERCYQQQYAEQCLLKGLHILDPQRFDVRGTLTFGTDCTVDINAVFEGDVVLGEGVSIGANSVIINSTIGNGVDIKPYCHIENAVIETECHIGPYARIRPDTQLRRGAKIGNFVETKKSVIGVNSKVNHLSYIGDSTIGNDVNVGAGTITCNYDGINKHKTVIDDGAFIGSNTSLVAPVVIGKGATVGAGSTISKAVPENSLSLTRAKQANLSNWKRPIKIEE